MFGRLFPHNVVQVGSNGHIDLRGSILVHAYVDGLGEVSVVPSVGFSWLPPCSRESEDGGSNGATYLVPVWLFLEVDFC